ncbi:ABC transporter ATP-binding protein [bacterium]|nr:ABC transporter ATP-binding protein [bacterium]
MSTPILQVDNLQLSLGGNKILTGISFDIKPGEHVGIIGTNGCGKTTLFNCISGFFIPDSGKINYQNEDITELAPHVRARKGIGRIFQNFGIFRELTVIENMILALENSPGAKLSWNGNKKALTQRALELLSKVKLETKAKELASSLSGGQMRLLEISRTLALGSDLILLDEPTAGVAPKMKQDVMAMLNELAALDKTIMIIEHDLSFIQKLCPRILVLDTGKVVMDGSPESVRSDPRLQEIYFGTDHKNVTTTEAA